MGCSGLWTSFYSRDRESLTVFSTWWKLRRWLRLRRFDVIIGQVFTDRVPRLLRPVRDLSDRQTVAKVPLPNYAQ